MAAHVLLKRMLWAMVALSAANVAGLGNAAQAAEGIPTVDLAIVSKTADVTRAHPNQLVTYTIVATNYGPDVAPSLDVTDLVDYQNSGLRFVDETCDQGVSADTPSCEYQNIAPGETVTTVVTVRVLRHSRLRSATNQACVSAEDTVTDLDQTNDCLTVTLPLVGGGR